MKLRASVIPLIIVGFLAGMLFHSLWSSAKATAVASNRWALETSLKEQLKAYHDKTGSYPKSMNDLEIGWLKDPQRREALLRCFYYENRGDTYLLWWPRTSNE